MKMGLDPDRLSNGLSVVSARVSLAGALPTRYSSA